MLDDALDLAPIDLQVAGDGTLAVARVVPLPMRTATAYRNVPAVGARANNPGLRFGIQAGRHGPHPLVAGASTSSISAPA